jgi:hypothetical protein
MAITELQAARLSEVARLLGAAVAPHVLGGDVVGERAGRPVRYRQRDETSVIVVELAEALPDTLLEVTPETEAMRDDTVAGRSIDVVTGDRAFDVRFQVEGAPSEVARALLDDTIRGWLVAHHPCRLELCHGQRVELELELENDPLAISDAIDTLLAFAAGLAARRADALLARDRTTGADAYRGLPDARAIEARSAAAHIEVAQLRDLRDARTSWVPYVLGAGAVVHLSAFYWLPVGLALGSLVLLPITVMLLGVGWLVVAELTGLQRAIDRRRRARLHDRLERELGRALEPDLRLRSSGDESTSSDADAP